MSELFMECVEEELEPWQKPAPEVHLIEDDDDEPIFVGELSNNQKKSNPPPVQKDGVGKQTIPSPVPQPVLGSSIMLPLNVVGNRLNTPAPSLTTLTPQPVIVNNQGFIVTSPSLNSGDFIASLGAKYPPGTKFAIVQAGQPQFIQQVNPGTALPGAVHRPQVQKISNNIVTLSNVQSPAVYSANSNLVQVAMPVKTESNNRGPVTKRELLPKQVESAKKVKLDLSNETEPVENVNAMKRCTTCQEQFQQLDALKAHMMSCCAGTETMDRNVAANNKRIMLVSEFYYGRFEGDGIKKEVQKTITFKCQSCLKVLKNNIRFMNHMKHHLELEKQNSESWENHTTCQHCYRQYMTPFQLQCHIESAHSPIESTTNCKICELAFESEQVLLEHMKNTHKPGEMPYACQVCNYRSSFFSEVETHFRKVHENTKDLLCPFCLKVQRSSHIYMQHYMKHQRKGIYRCGKCRLNFLTYKEKVEHRTFAHKTFKKPKALEGLPPGTKVTIRASISGKTSNVPSSADRSGVTVSPETQSFSEEAKSSAKSKSNGAGKGNRRPPTKFNMSLRNLSVKEGRYTCIECNTEVDDFFSHYMIASNCGACKYRTSCKVAIGNHMIRNHSKISKKRFARRDQHKRSLPANLSLVCLNCDLLVNVLNSNLMAKHLTDRPNHVCKVIVQKGDVKAQDGAHPDLKPPAKEEIPPPAASPPSPKQTDMKPVGRVVSECHPLSEPLLPAVSPERVVMEGCCGEEGKRSTLSSCAVDQLLDTSADKSDLQGNGEEPPTSLSVPEQETENPELTSP